MSRKKQVFKNPVICLDCELESERTNAKQLRCIECGEVNRKKKLIENGARWLEINYHHARGRKYGLSADDVINLWDEQNHCCLVCGEEAYLQEVVIDHDRSCCPGNRSCGKCVRGLIHQRHNLALGHVKDNVDELKQLISYLERFEGWESASEVWARSII